ncbi:extracellular solute-binding protein [Paenarthrobacter nicotinovorans]|uniref:sugar ABC transporter substrate-binding protein n=1 Tax=Paenarthrobacter nicotinovorans TaxID=29320 RepID=UPI00382241E6
MKHTRSNRKRVAVLAAVPLAIAALVLTGCGRGDKNQPEAASVTVDSSPAKGTLEFWAPGADGAQLPELWKKFQADNPDVKINMTQIPSADFASKMTAAIAAGTVPDAVFVTTEEQPGVLATGGFAPVPKDLVNHSDFFDASWKSSVVNGTSYGVPWYTYAQTFQYRKDLADAAGVKAPTNWNELTTFAETLKNKGVQDPIALQVGYDIYTAQELNVFAKQNGGGLLAEDGKKWTINTPTNVKALEYWSSLIKDGLASADGPGFLDQVPYFTKGTNAGELNGPWFPGWLDQANGAGWSTSHLAMAVPAAGPSGDLSSSVGGGSLFVFKGAKNADAAWKLIRYMAQPDTQVQWYKLFGNLPANSTAWNDPTVANAPNLNIIRKSIEVGTTIPNASTWGEVGKTIASQMEQVARGKISAQAALEAAQSQADSIGTGNK